VATIELRENKAAANAVVAKVDGGEQSAEKKVVKRVTMQEDAESIHTANSPVRKTSLKKSAKADSNSPAAAPANKNSSAEASRKASPFKEEDDDGFLNVNRRHRQDFNKHKSSNAMKTLLATEEQD